MVPNNFIPYIHDAYGGCLIFTGEGILKHFCIGCGLGFTKDPKMKCFAPPIRPTFSAGTRLQDRMPQALKWDRSVPVHFMAFFFGESLSPCLGEKRKKALQRSRMRYEICKMCLQAFNFFPSFFWLQSFACWQTTTKLQGRWTLGKSRTDLSARCGRLPLWSFYCLPCPSSKSTFPCECWGCNVQPCVANH